MRVRAGTSWSCNLASHTLTVDVYTTKIYLLQITGTEIYLPTTNSAMCSVQVTKQWILQTVEPLGVARAQTDTSRSTGTSLACYPPLPLAPPLPTSSSQALTKQLWCMPAAQFI